MRIGLYGMPTAGKSYIMDRIDFMEVLIGSRLLREYDPSFDLKDEYGREEDRKAVAKLMMEKETFIMDGHYAFGDEVAFTDEEGEMYDIYLYLYINPSALKNRIASSQKNNKYLRYDIEEWQKREIAGLRNYCHTHNKDFYVIDNPPFNEYADSFMALKFIRDIVDGYSCVGYAKKCVNEILKYSSGDSIILIDGDKTLTIEDTSNVVFGYTTNLYDGNFYTGYQAWKQNEEFKGYVIPTITEMPVHLHPLVKKAINKDSFILTSGNEKVWRFIASELGTPFYYGPEMAAETKLYITKFLQKAGKKVTAYGDGMNDYYMLIQADEGYLVSKKDGRISRSLAGRNLEGLTIV
jgi:hypothetical protein